MSHLAHNRFYPRCTCSWILGYGVNPDDSTVWMERLTIEDPQCPIDHSLPGNRDAVTAPPTGGEANEGKDQGSTGSRGHLAAGGDT